MRKEVTIILLAAAALIPATYAQSLCYTCTNCPTVGNLAPTSCPIGTAGCFRREEADGTVTRGCVSALSATEAQTCQAGNLQSGACRTCPDNLCNAKADFQRCHRCDNTGQNCAQLQNPTDNTYVCQNYMDSCGIVMVQERTVRGCVAEINFPQNCNALTCESCADNFCNSYIFPNNRLRCNRCSGTTDQCFNAITGTDLSRVCDNYVQSNDQCYTSVNENQQVNRGCRSDDGTGHANCPGPNCESCFQSNCNSIAARWNPTLSCVACAATDVACNWGYSETDATACTSTVFLGQTESCFQRDLADGTSVRGCSLDSATNSVCAETDANCMMCTRSGCNRLSHRSHSCYQCRSSNDDRCRNEVKEELEPASCLGNTQTLADRGCYTLIQDNGHVVRGCLRYLDANLMAECRAGDRCDICDTDNCNHEPSGAATVKISLLLVAMVGVVMKMFV